MKDFLGRQRGFTDGNLLLAEIYVQQGDRPQAETLLRQVLQENNLTPRDRGRITAMLEKLTTPQTSEDNHSGKQ